MRQLSITVRPESRFPVPVSDGYSVYSSLLAALDAVDDAVSERIHDSELGTLHCSGLLGNFGHSDRDHHKLLQADRTYGLSLGVVAPEDEDVFQALVQALVLDGDELELTNGTLRVESFESTNATHEELLVRANDYDAPTVEVTFRTPTCIEEAGDVTTMFPTRTAVFESLVGKWNRTVPSEYEFDLSRDALASSVIEKPDARSYDTHSVLVNRITTDDGETRPLFRQGFTGDCEYQFKGASESLQNAVTALALFARYAGVGSAVARGCGSVSVEVKE